MFNFKTLIKKYSQGNVKAVIFSGYYDMEQGGKYIKSEKEIDIIPAAVVPLSDEELKFNEGGVYDDNDAKLYCYEYLEKGTKIIYENKSGVSRNYTVMGTKNYSDYDNGLCIYKLKRVKNDDRDN